MPGLLDGLNGGGGLLGISPQALGIAMMANSGPSRMPHGLLSDFGQAAAGAQQLQGQQYQNAIQQLQLPMLAQRYQLMQDAMTGTGAFGGGGPSQQDASQAALSQGGGPTVQNAATMDTMLRSGQQNDTLRRALIMEQLIPGAGKAMLEKNMPGFQNLREGSALFDPGGHIVAQNPRAPPNTILNQGPGGQYSVSPLPGALSAESANQAVPFQLKNLYEYGIGGPSAGSGAPSPGTQGASAPAPSGLPGAPTSIPSQKYVTSERGTAIPVRPANEIPPGTENYKAAIERATPIVNAWNEKRELLDTTANRIEAILGLAKDTQAQGVNIDRAKWANNIRTFSPTAADMIMNAKDTANIKTAESLAWQEALGQVKTINQGAGGRILKVEVEQQAEKGINPDMPPDALYKLGTDVLGGIYQSRNMIDDFQRSGYVNAGRFVTDWRANPLNSLENHQQVARQYIGPLRGMSGGPGTAIDPDAARQELIRRGVIRQ